MFEINNTLISPDSSPYVVAEISANHGGSLKEAIQAICIAKNCGASAVKIQTYTPDTMTINSSKDDFKIKSGLWANKTLYELYKEAYIPFEWHRELFSYAKKESITLFSSPFDETAVDLLEELGAPAYKIASFEIVDLPLIKRVAECKKPIIISTGMANLIEIKEAIDVAIKYGSGDIMLLHCISSYPTPLHDSNLNSITFLKNEFGFQVGLSDHSESNLASTVAVALGAPLIEKHFKPNVDTIGPDSSFSLAPEEFKSLVRDCNDAWLSKGKNGFNRSGLEIASKKFRRSIYFINNLDEGQKISKNDIKIIRPGFGIPPKFYNNVIGKRVNKNIKKGDPVTFEDIIN